MLFTRVKSEEIEVEAWFWLKVMRFESEEMDEEAEEKEEENSEEREIREEEAWAKLDESCEARETIDEDADNSPELVLVLSSFTALISPKVRAP